jgi:hypothetical protein
MLVNNLRPLLAVFDNSVPITTILDFLNSRWEVKNWSLSALPNTVTIISDNTLESLQSMFVERFPRIHFLLLPIDPFRIGGLMDPKYWNFINHPEPSGKNAAPPPPVLAGGLFSLGEQFGSTFPEKKDKP